MSEATALAVVNGEGGKESATALMRMATDVASVCREIVLKTAMDLQGKKYVKVEGWMSIAAAYGCVPSIKSVEEDERGVKAIAELRKHDGTVLATAEGYVGLDEPRWATQPLYARRGMAQTRAVSRVCRSVFAFVVTLIDSGLQTTPAEEIPYHGEASQSSTTVVSVPVSTRTEAPGKAPPERSKRTTCKYGRAKGKFLCDIDEDDLDFQLKSARKSVAANDPKWHKGNEAWLQAVEEEVERRK